LGLPGIKRPGSSAAGGAKSGNPRLAALRSKLSAQSLIGGGGENTTADRLKNIHNMS